MPDMLKRKIYSGVALRNVMQRAMVYDPAAILEVGSDGYLAPVQSGRIIPVQGLNAQQLLPYNRLRSENKDKTGKAITFEEFAYQDYLGAAVM